MSCQNQQLRVGGAVEKRTLGGNRGGISVGEIAIPASFFLVKKLFTRKTGKKSYVKVHKYKKSRRSGRRSRRY
jgi:hypothetical protein